MVIMEFSVRESRSEDIRTHRESDLEASAGAPGEAQQTEMPSQGHFASSGSRGCFRALCCWRLRAKRNETTYFADVTGQAPRLALPHTFPARRDPVQSVG